MIALEEARELAERARAGEDFEELARDYSDDPGSAQKGGDLGYFPRGRMVREFEEVAFGMKPGDVSDPVLTRFGWHVIKVEDRRGKGEDVEVRARHILVKVEPGEETLERLDNQAQELLKDAEQLGDLRGAAQEEGLKVGDTGFFGEGTFVPGIGTAGALVAFAFHARVGSVRSYEDEDAFYVVQLTERKEAGVQPLGEVREQVRRLVELEKRRELARRRLEPALYRLSRGESLKEVGRGLGMEVKETGKFTRTGYIPGVGGRNAFVEVAFRLKKPGDHSGVVTTERAAYILELVERFPPDREAFEKEKEDIRGRMLAQRRQEVYTAWLEGVKRRAEVQDKRYLFYEF